MRTSTVGKNGNSNNKDIIQALLNISSLITCDKPLEQLYCEIHRIISGLITVKNIAIARADLLQQKMNLDYFLDEKDGQAYQGRVIDTRNSLTEYVLSQKKPFLLSGEDILSLYEKSVISQIHGTLCTSWIGVPIIHINEVLGIVIVQSYETDVIYTMQDLEILSFVSSNISILMKQRQIAQYEQESKQALERSLITITEQKAELESTLTKLKEAQTELIQKEKMASLGSLVAGVAHEINTPLGICVTGITNLEHQYNKFSMLVASEKARDSDFGRFMEDVEETCKIIKANSERAATLISSFKQIAIDQSSESERLINFNQYLHEVILSLNPLIKKTKHQVVIECAENIEIFTKAGALSQLITNLVTNSFIHGFETVESGQILIKVTNSNDILLLTFSDNGLGMSELQSNQFFEPFYTTKRNQGGSGLGGHIIYNIVHSVLGGKVELNSKLNQGTELKISIPFTKDA